MFGKLADASIRCYSHQDSDRCVGKFTVKISAENLLIGQVLCTIENGHENCGLHGKYLMCGVLRDSTTASVTTM